jgi:hypothetical protein
MWICPRCRHKFGSVNQSHTCDSYTIEYFLHEKSDIAIDLFDAFIAAYRKIGDIEIHPVKTRIALVTKIRFCSINKIGIDFIDGHLVFSEAHTDNFCFYKIENLAEKYYLHHFRLYNKSEINTELIKYMKLAYGIGNKKQVETSIIIENPQRVSPSTYL